jgi:hypothetical protein
MRKSKMAAVLKEICRTLLLSTLYDYCGVKCYVFGVKEFIKMIIGSGETK